VRAVAERASRPDPRKARAAKPRPEHAKRGSARGPNPPGARRPDRPKRDGARQEARGPQPAKRDTDRSAHKPEARGANKPEARGASKPEARGPQPAKRDGAHKTEARRPAHAGRPGPTHEKPRPQKPREAQLISGPPRSGAVALIGRANVGKSTLLNAALGHALAIVSPTPQTTRDTLLGVVHRGSAELRLLDTPGLHKPKSELGRVMNQHAREAARAADVVVFVTDVPSRGPMPAALAPHPGDLTLLQSFKEGATEAEPRPIVLAINKADLVKDKKALLPLIDGFSKVLPFTAIVPMSAKQRGDADRLLDVVAGLCPEGPWQFGPDDITDRPARYFAAEYVREQILRATRLEVPHAAAVTIDRFVEPEGPGPVEIDVTIHVERHGQKKILIGKGGETMKRIGTAARLRLKELLDRKVVLKLWVRVTPAWRANAQRLAEMGYERKPQEEQATLIFADLTDEALDAGPASVAAPSVRGDDLADAEVPEGGIAVGDELADDDEEQEQ
jgi:GTP-binding protein Era